MFIINTYLLYIFIFYFKINALSIITLHFSYYPKHKGKNEISHKKNWHIKILCIIAIIF
jgi:hypothetical protein